MLPPPLLYALRVAWHAANRWIDGSGPQLGASIAFYTMFALAPWLVLTIAVASLAFGADAARGQIVGQIQGLVGGDAARAIEAMIASAWKERASLVATLVGAATLLLGASGVFAEMRRAMNAIAGIAPRAHPVTVFVRVRVRAFALLLGFGFLAVAALAMLATLVDWVVSGALLTVAFAALLRWLPDRPPRHRGLAISAIVSAVLFTLGKNLIGLYLARAGVASSYGAAGSFVVVMLWVYYSSQIMLFGAACGYADEALRLGPAHGPADAVPACSTAEELPHAR
jgi:membrane protein